jgi:hypothetical protein
VSANPTLAPPRSALLLQLTLAEIEDREFSVWFEASLLPSKLGIFVGMSAPLLLLASLVPDGQHGIWAMEAGVTASSALGAWKSVRACVEYSQLQEGRERLAAQQVEQHRELAALVGSAVGGVGLAWWALTSL